MGRPDRPTQRCTWADTERVRQTRAQATSRRHPPGAPPHRSALARGASPALAARCPPGHVSAEAGRQKSPIRHSVHEDDLALSGGNARRAIAQWRCAAPRGWQTLGACRPAGVFQRCGRAARAIYSGRDWTGRRVVQDPVAQCLHASLQASVPLGYCMGVGWAQLREVARTQAPLGRRSCASRAPCERRWRAALAPPGEHAGGTGT